MPAILRIAAVGMALACFVAALAYPAVGTCLGSAREVTWFENSNILLFGWLAIFAGQPGWFANVPFAIAVFRLTRRQRVALPLIGVQAALLGIALVTLHPGLGLRLPHNEGFDEPVCALGPGFWLWVAAQATVLLVSLSVLWRGGSVERR